MLTIGTAKKNRFRYRILKIMCFQLFIWNWLFGLIIFRLTVLYLAYIALFSWFSSVINTFSIKWYYCHVKQVFNIFRLFLMAFNSVRSNWRIKIQCVVTSTTNDRQNVKLSCKNVTCVQGALADILRQSGLALFRTICGARQRKEQLWWYHIDLT